MQEDFTPNRNTTILVFVFLSLLSIFFLTAHLSVIVRSLRSFVSYILLPTPVTASKAIKASQGFAKNIADIVGTREKNLELQSKLDKYFYLENDYERMLSENLRLKSLLNFIAKKPENTIAAQVIIREPSAWFNWIVINKGSEDGVKLDDPVIALTDHGPAALGRIQEVEKGTAKVVLITNVLSAVPAMSESTGDDGLVEGQNGPFMKLNYLALEKKLNPGETVVTSPISSVFPEQILLGTIKKVTSAKDEPFQYATVMPGFNLNSLREVVVLVK